MLISFVSSWITDVVLSRFELKSGVFLLSVWTQQERETESEAFLFWTQGHFSQVTRLQKPKFHFVLVSSSKTEK